MSGFGSDAVKMRIESRSSQRRKGPGCVGEYRSLSRIKSVTVEVLFRDEDVRRFGSRKRYVFENLGMKSARKHLNPELAAFHYG